MFEMPSGQLQPSKIQLPAEGIRNGCPWIKFRRLDHAKLFFEPCQYVRYICEV